ncbi:UPF0057 membrane protein At2g24040-like [Euphorbia lathyris]|uniref:UPF0057 membrane protein At2g24040-like n=1 Tax=Euphorbia lathyris TaxID=212925 RepID=UPI0033143CC9
MPSGCEICCEVLMAILRVCLRHGCCTIEVLICLILTVPGIIYAIYTIIFVNRDEFFDEHRRPLYSSSY